MRAVAPRLPVQQEAWILTIGAYSHILAAGIPFANLFKAAWILTRSGSGDREEFVLKFLAKQGILEGVGSGRYSSWSSFLGDRGLCDLYPPLSSPAY